MNEELQKQIAEVLKQALEAAHKGGQWMAGQIPDVLHQLIVWTITYGVVSFIVATGVTVLSIKYWIKLVKWINDDKPDGSREFVAFPACGASILAGFFVAGCLINAIDALQAFVAPKLFLLEYAAHLVK